jgi:transcriptional regulator with XRE-family HTH domain
VPAPLTDAQRKTLISAREASGLTQRDVARAVGCSSQYVNRVERGAAVPSMDALLDIADAVGLEARVEKIVKITLRPKRKHRATRE